MKLKRRLETMLVLGALGLQVASGIKPQCGDAVEEVLTNLRTQQQKANSEKISGHVLFDFPFREIVDWNYINCVVDEVNRRARWGA